ncbi:phage tail protein [Xenorhabdus innexi]|uniref:Tail protein n=1 Tax=Xenorhabdus innexi TaxID=290109 RepID=A0A1N6MZM9_9GAMM|nr:phage tail protein [Xenorhabdus innexi]PHM37847.1 tail protein [Xenorhabdus innexi]SIP74323.1 conserved hypothetical protein [Xenorhabdus innexi]
MSNKYFALLTDSGANKLENAATSGNKLEITHMAVGDGHLPMPNADQSQLINEKHRAEIDRLFIDPNNPNQIIVEQVIPENEGNWWIREIGLYDEDNTLIAVGNCAALYKSQMQEQTVRMILPIGDRNLTGWIAELISGVATRSYVRGKIRDHAESRNHPDATLKNKGFVILSSAVDSNSETHAATPKAVKSIHELAQKAYDLANPENAGKKWVPLTRTINDHALNNDIRLMASDVGAYSKEETDTRIQANNEPVLHEVSQAMKLAETANQNATTAIKDAESKVPLTRTINDHALNNDIRLMASDVGAYSKEETDTRIQANNESVLHEASQAMKLAETANQNATTAIKDAESKVPLTRTINDHALNNDIRLMASDVGAYSKEETDTRIQANNEPVLHEVSQAMKLAETANHNATTAIKDAESKVPLTRRINGKELINDIKLMASDVGAYNKEETEQLIDGIKELANSANNNADSKVPMFRTINNKALLTDIMLNASDVDTYAKGEIDQQINAVRKLANDANNNVNGKVPLTRTVNNKALLTDIALTAFDVGAYSKSEIDSRIDKVTKNADGRLAKDENGADIPDKNAFVRNIGLGDLIGLKIESSVSGQDATIINLGKVTQISGMAIASAPIKPEHASMIGGITYYTNYYKIRLPISLSNGIISCHASIVCNNFDSQGPCHLADVKTQRSNSDGVGLSKDTLTISVTTPQLGWIPEFYYEVTGY